MKPALTPEVSELGRPLGCAGGAGTCSSRGDHLNKANHGIRNAKKTHRRIPGPAKARSGICVFNECSCGRCSPEGRAPSGSISVGHLRNVLARPNNPATPAQAKTSLRLTLAPKADTARYDRRSPNHQDHLDGQEVGHA